MANFPIAKPSLSDLEEKYVTDAVRSGWISSTGPYIDRFESDFAARCHAGHAIATNNGTTALHLVLAAAGVGPGDEVIVPAFTYIATANAVTYCGATPIFVDVDSDTWCIDPVQVAAAVTPRTKAVIAVDIYGHPADYQALRRICSTHHLLLVADAAESLGGSFQNEQVGALADATTFSFFGNKVLTSGEGGCVTTSDASLAAQMRLLKNQGMDPSRRYFFPVVGFNYRMTNVAAAILCAQLERFDDLLLRRSQIIGRYNDGVKEMPSLEIAKDASEAIRAPWMACLLVARDSRFSRDDLMQELAETGVDTRPFFAPLPAMPAYGSQSLTPYPVSNDLGLRGFNLPTYADLHVSDVNEILGRLQVALTGLNVRNRPDGS